MKIPAPERRPSRRDRLLGIGRISRGCTPGEAAFVRLLVKHEFDLVAAAEEVKLAVEVMAERSRRWTLVIRNWLRHRRLPPPCQPRKVRPYRASTPRAG